MSHKETIENYLSLQKDIKYIVKSKGTTITWICQQLNMNRSTFDRKSKNNKFSAEELLTILDLIRL